MPLAGSEIGACLELWACYSYLRKFLFSKSYFYLMTLPKQFNSYSFVLRGVCVCVCESNYSCYLLIFVIRKRLLFHFPRWIYSFENRFSISSFKQTFRLSSFYLPWATTKEPNSQQDIFNDMKSFPSEKPEDLSLSSASSLPASSIHPSQKPLATPVSWSSQIQEKKNHRVTTKETE